MNKEEALFCSNIISKEYSLSSIWPIPQDTSFLKNVIKTVIKDVSFLMGVNENNELIICFRCTDSKIDWFRNFMYKKIKINKNIRVHSGFYYSYSCVKNTIYDYINKFYKNVKRIIICGFSLGAAISFICSFDLNYFFPEYDLTVYTFGGPRVGNKYFVDYYNKNIKDSYRIVNGNDIVTRLPYSIFGFNHTEKLVHIGEDYKWWKIFGNFSSDHHMSKYINNIKKEIK